MDRLQGVVGKKGDPALKIWFSADDGQAPVKIQSKVAVGSFIFELMSVTY
jgi:Protein of unknown function (DUF3108)